MNNEPYKCLCSKIFKSFGSLKNHKYCCNDYIHSQNTYRNYILSPLPDQFDYSVSSNGFTFIGDFEEWLSILNSSFKYTITNSSTKLNTIYKKLICNVANELDCKMTINIVIKGTCISINFSEYHCHSQDQPLVTKNDKISIA